MKMEVMGPYVEFAAGQVLKLDKDQIAAREHRLEAAKNQKGAVVSTGPVQFKRGEIIEIPLAKGEKLPSAIEVHLMPARKAKKARENDAAVALEAAKSLVDEKRAAFDEANVAKTAFDTAVQRGEEHLAKLTEELDKANAAAAQEDADDEARAEAERAKAALETHRAELAQYIEADKREDGQSSVSVAYDAAKAEWQSACDELDKLEAA